MINTTSYQEPAVGVRLLLAIAALKRFQPMFPHRELGSQKDFIDACRTAFDLEISPFPNWDYPSFRATWEDNRPLSQTISNSHLFDDQELPFRQVPNEVQGLLLKYVGLTQPKEVFLHSVFDLRLAIALSGIIERPITICFRNRDPLANEVIKLAKLVLGNIQTISTEEILDWNPEKSYDLVISTVLNSDWEAKIAKLRQEHTYIHNGEFLYFRHFAKLLSLGSPDTIMLTSNRLLFNMSADYVEFREHYAPRLHAAIGLPLDSYEGKTIPSTLLFMKAANNQAPIFRQIDSLRKKGRIQGIPGNQGEARRKYLMQELNKCLDRILAPPSTMENNPGLINSSWYPRHYLLETITDRRFPEQSFRPIKSIAGAEFVRPKKYASPNEDKNLPKYLTISDLNDYQFLSDRDFEFYQQAPPQVDSETLIQDFDILLALKGSERKLAIAINVSTYRVAFDSNLLILRFKNNTREQACFSFLYLSSYAGRGALNRITRLGAQAHITAKELSQLQIPVYDNTCEQILTDFGQLKTIYETIQAHRKAFMDFKNKIGTPTLQDIAARIRMS